MWIFISHVSKDVCHLNANIQILMSVLRVHTTVIKSVPTLKAPSPVPVTVDSY